MANIFGSRYARFDTQAGANLSNFVRAKVKSIEVSNPTAGALTVTITVGGNTFISTSIPANGVIVYDYGEGQYMENFVVSGLPAGLIVTVAYA